eukprot:153137_1
MGNSSSKSPSHTNPKQLQTYQALLNMGFDDDTSFQAAQRFRDNIQKAVEHILTNQNTMKSAHTMNKVPAQEEKHKSNIFDDTACTCDRSDCDSIKRVKSLLVLYNNNIKDPSSFLDELNEQIDTDYTITHIINDYVHIVQIHCDTDENFEDIYASLNIRCKLDKCIGLRRNQRHEKLKNTNGITDLMDQIHSYLLHTFDTGCRLTKRERQILNNNNDSHGLFHRINDLLKDRRKRFSNINTTQNPYHHSKFVTHIQENKINANEDDFKQDSISNDVYSLSHRFNYWQRDKDLSVTPIHPNLKEEILNNKIFTLTLNEYEAARNKAERFLKSDKAKSLKFQYANFGSAGLIRDDFRADYYGIKHGSKIFVHHLTTLILYTDFDLLSYNFSSTFRKSRDNENMKKLIERHGNYYFFGRYLREAVEGYGDKSIHLKQRILYHGVSTPLIFSSVIAQFYHPTSTTKDVTVAQQFATNAGIVISLTKYSNVWERQHKFTLPCFDCEWFSRHAIEREVLFNGGLYYFQIRNIIECSTGQQYKSYLRAMAFIFRATTGGYTHTHGIDTTDEATIMQLIAHDKGVPDYILRMFDVYRQEKVRVIIRHCPHLSSLFFSDPTSIKTSFINLEIIHSIYPKCERIFIIKDLEPIEFTLQYVKQIISELSQSQWVCLEKITINNPWIKSEPSKPEFYKATKFDICMENRNVIIQRRSNKNK